MARKGLPKKYARMGFKKGWREYKKAKRKRKRKRTVRASKKTYKRRSRRMAKTDYWKKALMGGFGVAVVDQVADQLLQNFNIGVSDDIVKLGLGVYFARKRGFVGETARALAYINASRLMNQVNIGSLFSGLTGGSNNSTNSGW